MHCCKAYSTQEETYIHRLQDLLGLFCSQISQPCSGLFIMDCKKAQHMVDDHELLQGKMYCRCSGTHPDSDWRLVAQFSWYYSFGFIKERDERFGSFPRILGIGAKSRLILQGKRKKWNI
jgi:hypothetical protein